jgi:hypothetical protein
MIKNFFVLLILLSAVSVKAQVIVNVQWQSNKPNLNGDTIYYDSNRKLTWPDFKGRPDANSFAAAITESGFGYQLAMSSLNNRTTINIIVYCYFNKNKSWVKKGSNNDYALLHEQHHFDITYINTCLFIKKLSEAKFTKSNCGSLSSKIHDECFTALDKMQNDYDGETSNGRKKDVQAVWNKKIDEKLATLTTN